MSKTYACDILPSHEQNYETKEMGWVVRIHDETNDLACERWYDTQKEADAFIEGFVALSELQSNDGIINLDE
jgi:hypothetical protein